MAEKVSFSYQELSLDEVAAFHEDAEAGLFEFFSGNSPKLLNRYAHAKIDEVRDRSLTELDLSSSLAVMSSTEAAIRLDYLRRVYDRWRDPLSKEMRALHQKQGNRVGLEDDLLHLWKKHSTVDKGILGTLASAFKYRHWLAHGRYWTPKLGQEYDYATVFAIAEAFIDAMDAYNLTCRPGKKR